MSEPWRFEAVPASRSRGRYLLRFSQHAAQPVICLPWAGASAGVFRPWQPLLGARFALFSVQLPGRGGRVGEPLPRDLHTEVGQIVQAIRAERLEECHLVGHSMGAKLAYLTARELLETGTKVRSLVVTGCGGPGSRSESSEPRAADMTDDELVDYLRSFGGTPEEILNNQELLELLLAVLRADFRMNEAPLPQGLPPLHVPVLALGGTSDPYVGQDDLLAWESVSRAPFTCRMVEGGHFFPNSNRSEVVRAVQEHMDHA